MITKQNPGTKYWVQIRKAQSEMYWYSHTNTPTAIGSIVLGTLSADLELYEIVEGPFTSGYLGTDDCEILKCKPK